MWGRDHLAAALGERAGSAANSPQLPQVSAQAEDTSAAAAPAAPAPLELPGLSWRPMRARQMPAQQASSTSARESWCARRAQAGACEPSCARRVQAGAAAGSSRLDAATSSMSSSGSSGTSMPPNSSVSSDSSDSSDSSSERAPSREGSERASSREGGERARAASSDNEEPNAHLYGAAGRSSNKRIVIEQEMRAAERSRRPAHAAYKEAQLDAAVIQNFIVGEHRCLHMWEDGDEMVPCNHRLWARTVPAAMAALRKQRETFLAKGTKERGVEVYDALTFPDALQLHGPSGWTPPVHKVLYRVGPGVEQRRPVCREIFLANYPISLATLKRIVQRKRLGAALYTRLDALLRQHRVSHKTLHAIAWWLGYAKQVC